MEISKLRERLEQMVWLPPNWDGFESIAITEKVYEVGKLLLTMLEANHNVSSIQILVGVEPVGSLLVLVKIDNRHLEMTVQQTGAIIYEEYMGRLHLGSGSFYLSKAMLDSIIN